MTTTMGTAMVMVLDIMMKIFEGNDLA